MAATTPAGSAPGRAAALIAAGLAQREQAFVNQAHTDPTPVPAATPGSASATAPAAAGSASRARTAAAPQAGTAPAARPLAGLRVLELGQIIAAPFAGAILCDLGAEVIKLERPDGGDEGRRMGPPFRHDDSLIFQVFNHGKRSVSFDLKTVAGRARLERLAAGADVLLHNLRPGVLEPLGFGGPELCARHSRLVFCEISAFGHTGPLAAYPGYEPLIQAYSGLSATNGGPQDPPVRMGASMCDQGAGMWAVIGILAQLQRRQVTGRGGVVNTSLLETAINWNGMKNDAWVNLGQAPVRHASGHPGFVPYEAFDTADGPLLICCGNDRLFVKLATELGHPEWAKDPRFIDNRARIANQEVLLPALRALLRLRPRAALQAQLEAAGVPCAPVHTLEEALAQPQVDSLGILRPVPGEDFTLTSLPLSFDGARPAPTGRAPHLGEHDTTLG